MAISLTMPKPITITRMIARITSRTPAIRRGRPALGGGAITPITRSISSWRLVGGVPPSFSVATFRSPARRSARASDASAMRRSCSRSCGREAAIAARKCSRALAASMRSAARVPRMACAAALKRVSFSSSSSERVSSCCIAFRADLDSMRTWRGLGGMASTQSTANRFADSRRRRFAVVWGGPEADGGRIDVERAGGQSGLGIERVIAAWSDVVGRVGMKQGRQQLDLPAADAELVLAAAVGAHAALLAELIAREERLHAAEARRLEVDRARHHLACEDVVDVVDRRVPGDPVLEGRERVEGVVVVEVGVLEPGVGERLGDLAVEGRVGLHVDDRAPVGALEIDAVD